MARKILMITNIDQGEIAVFLATAHALRVKDPTVEVHLATFHGAENIIAATSQLAPNTTPIVYHEIEGPSMKEGLESYFATHDIPLESGLPASYLAQLSFSNTMKAIKDTIPIFVPFDGPQLAGIVSSILDIVKKVEADLIVVDTLMTPALTACENINAKYVCLSPNAIKDVAASSQPWAAGLWKFPALFSGFDYPVSSRLIPSNIFFNLYAGVSFHRNLRIRSVIQYLKDQLGISLFTPLDLIKNDRNVKILVSTHPELDFPLVVPSHVYPCGPIVRNGGPLTDTDPELYAWLARRPTIYINLGSICIMNQARASEMANALNILLQKEQQNKDSPGLQVLWKWKRDRTEDGSIAGDEALRVLTSEMAADLVRVVEWIEAEPSSILASGFVACSVHHGGANSYNEAVVSGVPQIVLPQWTDCYDYAQRVEYLGIGMMGNRKTKPNWTAQELSEAVSGVLFGAVSDSIRIRARELADMCKSHGDGAERAAQLLLQEVEHLGE